MSTGAFSTVGPFAYTGNNAYAYTGTNAYTGSNAYAYSNSMEAYGFDGFPGNGMLTAALLATRTEILRGQRPVTLGGAGDRGSAWSSLPPLSQASSARRHGPAVRAALIMSELLGSVAFDRNGHQAQVQATNFNGQVYPLFTMNRPDRGFFEGQLQLMDAMVSARDSRAPEILTQVAPPLAYFASIMNLQTGRHRHTLEALQLALQFSYAICMYFKHTLACPRPSEYSVTVQPLLEVPRHPAFPAGHAVEAHVTAALLGHLLGDMAPPTHVRNYLRRLAFRIAENRAIAGLHFPVDLEAGRQLGDVLSSYLLATAGQADSWGAGSFPATALTGSAAGATASFNEAAPLVSLSPVDVADAAVSFPVWCDLWEQAKSEWS